MGEHGADRLTNCKVRIICAADHAIKQGWGAWVGEQPEVYHISTFMQYGVMCNGAISVLCRSTVTAATAFLEAFQKVADMATSTRGQQQQHL